MNEEALEARFGFVFETYKEEMWWFEGGVVVWRIAILVAVSALPLDWAFRPMITFCVLLVSLVVQLLFEPFGHRKHNTAALVGLFILLVVFVAVLDVANPDSVDRDDSKLKQREPLLWSVMVLSFGFVVGVVGVIAKPLLIELVAVIRAVVGGRKGTINGSASSSSLSRGGGFMSGEEGVEEPLLGGGHRQ